MKDGEFSSMYDNDELNRETFGEGGNQPPYTPPQSNYVTYIPYGFTPKTYEERLQIKKCANIIGGSLLLLNVVAVVISFAVPFLLSFLGMSSENIHKLTNDAGYRQFFQIVVSTLMFTLPFVIFFKGAGYRISDLAIYGKPKEKTFLPLFLIGIAFCSFANMAVSFAGGIFEQFGFNYNVDFGEYPTGFFGFLLATFSTAIVPPLVEEFACRGLILGSLRKFGDGFAIIVSSVLFGIMHGNFEQMPFAFLVGLVLAYVTVKSGSLWVAVAIHAFNNFVSVVFNYLPNTLSDTAENIIYTLFLALVMLLGLVAMFLYHKNIGDYSIKKSETESTDSKKAKWFFGSATIVIFIIISFLQSLTFFFQI